MMRGLWNKCVNWESVSYVICGVLTTAVDWVVYAVLCEKGVDYRISQAVSWVAAVLFAYVVNKLIVFRNFNLNPLYLAKECAAFFAARIVSGVITLAALVILVDWMGWNEYVGKLGVSALGLVLNYVFSKLWIFKKCPEESNSDR